MVDVLFYLMALGAVATAVGVVVARSPVASVISLLGSFFFLSVIYLIAGYRFLAAIQILVYGGAVIVLFLFVVMLLNLGEARVAKSEDEPLFHATPRALSGLAVAVALGSVSLIALLRSGRALWEGGAALAPPAGGRDPLIGLAEAMFTRYALPFEGASVLLMAAAVGVLVLAKRQRRDTPRVFPDLRAGAGPPPAVPPAAPETGTQPPEPERPEPGEVLS